MSRMHLLCAASAAVLACAAGNAFAQAPTTVTGGGSTLAEFDYITEFGTYNASSPTAIYQNAVPGGGTNTYWPSGSGTGQLSFINNDNTCNSSKVQTGTATCQGGGGANAVAYGASDATLSASQINQWYGTNGVTEVPYGAAVSGNLIQLPSMGVGVSFPVVNAKMKKNGGVSFTDNDLCNIFTGGFTNWNQTSAKAKLTAGTITVVYRSDGSGTSFLFLNHLATVCTGASAPPAGVTLSATTNFATIFPTTASGIFTTPVTISGVTYYTPSNFVGESGSGGIANYLSSLSGTTVTSATAYLTPDFTTIDPKSNAVLSNGQASALVVAGVINASNGTSYTPTNTNIITGLANAASGQYLTPPTGAALSNPSAYVPLIQTTKSGYPVVGYTTFDYAQCYKNTKIGASIIKYTFDHYAVAAYKTDETNNGFIPLPSTKAASFFTVIDNNILTNAGKQNLNIDNAIACKGKGR
jgi:ABC-type phosphate transport system substrate-binding protein